MEDEIPQPAARQIDGAATADFAVVAGAEEHEVHMQESVAADRQCLDAAIARDEALAHALHMEELMEMSESQMRARPSLLPAAQEVPADALDPIATFSVTGVQDPFSNFSGVSAQDPFATFSGTSAQDPFSAFSGAGAQDPFATFSGASAGAQATTETEIDFIPRYDDDVPSSPSVRPHPFEVGVSSSGPTSSRDIPGDDVATLPSETLPACIVSPATCTPNATISALMNELELWARPSLVPATQEVPAGAQDPFATLSGDGAQDPFPAFSGAGDQDPFATFAGAGDQDPFATFSGASADAHATTETEIDFIPRYDDDVASSPSVRPHPSEVAASSVHTSSQDVPGDDVATDLPSKTLPACVASPETCTPNAIASARPIVPADDVVSSKRRALLADAHAQIILAGMAEEPDNGWYESIIGDADEEELEQMEELGLRESLQQCLPRRYEAPKYDEPYNTTAAVAGEEERELCLQKFCNRWSISTSNLAPDELGPSTKRAKVPPLADDEVPKFDCGICMETLDVFDIFHGMLCKHKFCTACMEAYIEGRIHEGNLPIPCPDPACKGEDDGILHPEKCKKAIDFAAFGDWGVRLTERALPASRRAYCPNRQCGIMLETSGEPKPAMAPCPACNHLLCAACGMEWSADGSGKHDCAKGPDAALMMKLARERKWKQCPRCKMIVEKIDGCNTMSCRCRCVFCYRCGRPTTRPQAEEMGGGEACRCHDLALAFAFAHHHQLHGEGHVMGGPPPDAAEELHGLQAFDLNADGGAHQ